MNLVHSEVRGISNNVSAQVNHRLILPCRGNTRAGICELTRMNGSGVRGTGFGRWHVRTDLELRAQLWIGMLGQEAAFHQWAENMEIVSWIDQP